MENSQKQTLTIEEQLKLEREISAMLRKTLGKKDLEQNYIIQMLLSCVERAENFIDGGPIMREAEKHVHSWRIRLDKIEKQALAREKEMRK